jgi:protein O-mannosyl-transferase
MKISNSAKQKNSKKKANSDIFKIISSGYYPFIILVIISFILYFQSLSFDYINFDDDNIIQNNIFKLQNPSTIIEAFKTDPFFNSQDQEFYRPLQTVTYIIDAIISGKSLWMFHLTNILLHTSAAILLFLLLINLEFNRKLSLIFSIIFVVNPLFTHAVIWLPSRGDLLICVFCLLSFLCFINYSKSKKLIYLIIHLITFLLAVFSKETALLLPLLILIYFFLVQINQMNYHYFQSLTSFS